MERRVNGKVETYITNFKTNLCNKIKNIDLPPDNQKELLEYVYDYDRLCLTKEDFVKRKRTKNAIPGLNRCNAKRANGEQCTRRRKDDCEFCGTHEKGRPHGLITAINDNEKKMKKIEVFAKEIMGIVYYLDKNAKSEIRKLLIKPDSLDNVDGTIGEVVGILTGTKQIHDSQKIETFVRETLDYKIIWNEVEKNIDIFSQQTVFEGGYKADSLISRRCTEESFQSNGITTLMGRLRDIRNALSHGKDQRSGCVISPTFHNQKLIKPWAYLTFIISQEIMIYKGL